MKNVFDITTFGAVDDGVTDNTAAIQKALDAAAPVKGCVIVPPGDYVCGCVHIPRGVTLAGYHAWSYRHNGGSTLILRDAEDTCLLDLTGAVGCTIRGICLDGRRLGTGIHGMSVSHSAYNGAGEEDTPTIEDCRISHFSGNGIHLKHIWCFSIRHSQCISNLGHGIYIDGWDGFILDNWLSGNGGAGLCADVIAAAITATGNRVEWNRQGGFICASLKNSNITGNYFDRSGGPALSILTPPNADSNTLTITGNVFNRSGAGNFSDVLPENPLDRTHIRLERCVNTVVVGNTFCNGKNDDASGLRSPDYGMVLGHLRACVIKDNVMQCGMVKQGILDLGDHEGDVEISGNIGAAMDDWPGLERKI